VSLGILADTFETACTWSAFEGLHAALVSNVRAAMKRTLGAGFISCRFTHVYPDGPAPYYTFLGPITPGHELEAWQEIKATACDTIATHGATITHHHSVGRTHRPWYAREAPAPFLAGYAAMKKAIDPSGIMNPSVLID
jgi:alkyldihydroxyacetonephosphate synthase